MLCSYAVVIILRLWFVGFDLLVVGCFAVGCVCVFGWVSGFVAVWWLCCFVG